MHPKSQTNFGGAYFNGKKGQKKKKYSPEFKEGVLDMRENDWAIEKQ